MWITRLLGGLAMVGVAALVWWYGVGGMHRPASDPAACATAVTADWVRGGTECLRIRTYRSATGAAHPDLVVVLHGDAPFEAPSYQYAAARIIAGRTDSVVAIGLLRPGYTDAEGFRSSGVRGHTVGDNYTPEVVDAIAAAIGALRDAYHPAHIVLVGHSGGAAIAADMLGRHPSRLDGAVLVSCPCDLATWRRHMMSMQWSPIWLLPIRSLSPEALARTVDPRATVAVVVGGRDTLAPPAISHGYAAQLEARGVRVTLTEIPGAPHNILLDSAVVRQIVTTLDRVRRD
jgi:pimeloyl-ACP methyl ester carboxylesterase